MSESLNSGYYYQPASAGLVDYAAYPQLFLGLTSAQPAQSPGWFMPSNPSQPAGGYSDLTGGSNWTYGRGQGPYIDMTLPPWGASAMPVANQAAAPIATPAAVPLQDVTPRPTPGQPTYVDPNTGQATSTPPPGYNYTQPGQGRQPPPNQQQQQPQVIVQQPQQASWQQPFSGLPGAAATPPSWMTRFNPTPGGGAAVPVYNVNSQQQGADVHPMVKTAVQAISAGQDPTAWLQQLFPGASPQAIYNSLYTAVLMTRSSYAR